MRQGRFVMRRILSALLVGFCGFLSITSESHSEHFILGVDPANQSRDDYRVGLLRLALEQATGDHTMEVVHFDVNRSRAIRALAAGSAVFNVIDSGNSRSREKRLTLVPIPLTRGLLGYRLLVVKRSNLHLFSDIDNFDSLQWKITFGSSPSWPDTEIMRHSGLKVVTGEKSQLYPMLRRGRFVAYPRSVQEVSQELRNLAGGNAEGGVTNPLVIEPSVMLSYRFDSFFYTGPDDESRARIIEEGLLAAYESGAFETYFNSHPSILQGLGELRHHRPLVFSLENPDLSERIRNIPEKFWISF